MRNKNLFASFSDEHLLAILRDFEKWNDTGVIPSDGPLAGIRDTYVQEYDAHGLIIMQQELLLECALRWKRLVEEEPKQ